MERGRLPPLGCQLLRQKPRAVRASSATRGSSCQRTGPPMESRATDRSPEDTSGASDLRAGPFHKPSSSFQKFTNQNWMGFYHLYPNANSPFHMQGSGPGGEIHPQSLIGRQNSAPWFSALCSPHLPPPGLPHYGPYPMVRTPVSPCSPSPRTMGLAGAEPVPCGPDSPCPSPRCARP